MTQKNLLFLRICCLAWSTTIAFGVYVISAGSKYAIVTMAIFVGILLVPVVPISLNFARELTFPQEPAVITGGILMSSRITGFVFTFIVTAIADSTPAYSLPL